MKPFPARGPKKKHCRPEGKERHRNARCNTGKSQNSRAAIIPGSGQDVVPHRDQQFQNTSIQAITAWPCEIHCDAGGRLSLLGISVPKVFSTTCEACRYGKPSDWPHCTVLTKAVSNTVSTPGF